MTNTSGRRTKKKKKRRRRRKKEAEEEKEEAERYIADQKCQILYEYNDAPGKHQGIARILGRIKLTHNWCEITKDVKGCRILP